MDADTWWPAEVMDKAALAFIEQSDRGDEWAKLQRTIFGPDASDGAVLGWRAQHGPVGDQAESAALGAVLALFARDGLTAQEYAALVAPMGQALPWLVSVDARPARADE